MITSIMGARLGGVKAELIPLAELSSEALTPLELEPNLLEGLLARAMVHRLRGESQPMREVVGNGCDCVVILTDHADFDYAYVASAVGTGGRGSGMNPPSGIASGYVFFDIAALALAPLALAVTRRVRRGDPEPMPEAA